MSYGPNAPSFALNFHQICFTSIFTPKIGFIKKFATSAHIRIFLAFRIYINFYSNLKIEPATPDLHLNFLKCTQCKKSCFLLFFELGNSDLFMFGQFWQGKSHLSPFLDYECMVSFWPSYSNLFLNPKYLHSYTHTSLAKMTLSFRWNRGSTITTICACLECYA